jgi:thiamine biosynthesis lipoprotein
LLVPRPRSAEVELVSREVFLMGTRTVLSTWADDRPAGLSRLERLLSALEATDAQLSPWHPESEVSRLNAAAGSGPSSLSPSLCALLETLDRWTRETSRAFDPSVGALTAAWAVHGHGHVPSRAQLEIARSDSGWHRLAFDPKACTLALPAGMSLDVGAFGKGEALDRARAFGNGRSPWLVDLGGQVAVGGAPPNTSGWDISIAHPRDRTMPVLRIKITGGSLATSAGSERDLRVRGRRIGHIVDPRTGRPAAFDGSVSVWHEQAVVSDVLSTALFVMGPRKGLEWAEARGIAAVYLIPHRKGAVVSRASTEFRRRFKAP